MSKIFCTKTIPKESFSSLNTLKDHNIEVEVWNDLEKGPIPRDILLEKLKTVMAS